MKLRKFWSAVQGLFCFVLLLVTLWNIHLAAKPTLFTRQPFYFIHTTDCGKSNICFRKIKNLFHYGVFPRPCLWYFIMQYCNPKVSELWSTCGPKGLQMPVIIVSLLWSFPDDSGVGSIVPLHILQIKIITNGIIFVLSKLTFRTVICVYLTRFCSRWAPVREFISHKTFFFQVLVRLPYDHSCRSLPALKPHNLRKWKCGLFLLLDCGSGTTDTELGDCELIGDTVLRLLWLSAFWEEAVSCQQSAMWLLPCHHCRSLKDK